VVLVRRDTREEVDTRPMSPAERQLELRGVAFEPEDEDEDEDGLEGEDGPH
jgi:hypothetical protein